MGIIEPIQLKHKEITDRFRDSEGLFNGDYCFGNLFAWGGVFNTQVCFEDAMYTAIAEIDDLHLLIGYPIGSGDKIAFIRSLSKYAEEHGKTPVLGLVPGNIIKKVNRELEGVVAFKRKRNSDDYVYLTEKLIDLSGDELHSKKNMLNSFLKNEFVYEEINEKNISEAKAFCLEKCYTPDEKVVTERFFDNFTALELNGAVLKIEGKIVASTVGECRGKTVIIHTEKAEKTVRGAYAAINNLFLKNTMSHTVYVNREDDMGLENLRKAKLSYKPEFMVEKYLGHFI